MSGRNGYKPQAEQLDYFVLFLKAAGVFLLDCTRNRKKCSPKKRMFGIYAGLIIVIN
jgi:hypothetical protein